MYINSSLFCIAKHDWFGLEHIKHDIHRHLTTVIVQYCISSIDNIEYQKIDAYMTFHSFFDAEYGRERLADSAVLVHNSGKSVHK